MIIRPSAIPTRQADRAVAAGQLKLPYGNSAWCPAQVRSNSAPSTYTARHPHAAGPPGRPSIVNRTPLSPAPCAAPGDAAVPYTLDLLWAPRRHQFTLTVRVLWE